LNHNRIVKTLVSLGLSQADSEVYIHLAINGPQKAEIIAETLKLQEEMLKNSLENLKKKGVVTHIPQQSPLFFAFPFEQVLDILMTAHLKETQDVEQSKNKILSKWQNMIEDPKS